MKKVKFDLEPLASLGLSPTEVRVYVALLELGSSQAGGLIRRTGIQNSVMHLTLGRLVAEGVISYILRGKIKVYQVVDPRQLVAILEQRKSALQNIMPALLAMKGTGTAPQAEVYEGLSGLRSMCFRFIEDAEPDDEYLFLGFSSSNAIFEEEVYTFYREFSEVRINRGLKLRGVAHETMRKNFDKHEWPHRNIRYVQYPILKGISICRNKAIIVPWDQTRVSFLISSDSFANNLRDYFGELWKNSHK